MSESRIAAEIRIAFVQGHYDESVCALERSASHPNPFAFSPALQPLLPRRGKAHEGGKASAGSMASALISTRADGTLNGVWPMNAQKHSGLLRIMRAPNVPLYDTDGTPMIVAGHERAVLKQMIAFLAADPALPKVLLGHSLIAEGPVWDALQWLSSLGLLRLTVIESWERSILEGGAEGAETYFRRFSSARTRKTIRAKIRRLQEFAPLSLAIHKAVEDIPAAFATFLKLEASGWKGNKRTALKFHPDDARYSLELVTGLARTGRAFIGVLNMGERPVAAGLFLRAAGEVNFWRTAYDNDLSRFSPGKILDVMITDHLCSQPWFNRLDSGTDSAMDPTKLLWTQRRKMANVVIDCRGSTLAGHIVVITQRLRLWLKRRRQGFFSHR